MTKVVTFKEKEAYSIEKIPADPDSFFENFIKIFSSYNFTMPMPLTVDEKGPRGYLKTTFQFLGMMGMNLLTTIRFEIAGSKLIAFSQPTIEITVFSPGGKKMIAKSIEKNFRPLLTVQIKKAVNNTFEYKKKEIESGTKDVDPLKQLKLRLVNGEISEEEYLRKKKLLED